MTPSKQAAEAAEEIIGQWGHIEDLDNPERFIAAIIDARFAAPKEPSPGLLMSMAIRYDHGLGVPGYYDQSIFQASQAPVTHAKRLEATLATMHQLWEEVTGNGFYQPDLEEKYKAAYAAAKGGAHAPSDLAERICAACIPGGDSCDPQQVADNIREFFAKTKTEDPNQTKLPI